MFLKYKDLTSKEAYEYYKENRETTAEAINQYNYFKKAVEGLFMTIQKNLVEQDGGVCMDGFGYTCNIVEPEPTNRRTKSSKRFLDRFKKDYIYKPYFFPDKGLEDWTMSGAMDKRLKKKVSKSKIKYKMFPLVCTDYLINQDFSRKAKKRKKGFEEKYNKENRRYELNLK